MPETTTRYITVPAGAPTTACQSCSKPIYFVEMPSGRPMPVDCHADEQCSPPSGREDGRGISHFATCNDPDRFRKRRS